MSQLLLMGPGTVREFDFSEPFADPEGELHLRGPVSGHARLMRTSEGILTHTEFHAPISVECARCLDEAAAELDGELDEEFLPTTDIHTGWPIELIAPHQDEQPLIDEHHEIVLDELLRQNILTNLPLRPLCQATCPGLCPTCGERLTAGHPIHPEITDDQENEATAAPVDPSNPFARLAVLLHDDHER